MDESLIREKLKKVIDPELFVNIVDLGLIYKVEVNDKVDPNDESNFKVKIVMTLTSPGCPLAGTFQYMVWDALREIEGLDPEKEVKIELTFDPPWTLRNN